MQFTFQPYEYMSLFSFVLSATSSECLSSMRLLFLQWWDCRSVVGSCSSVFRLHRLRGTSETVAVTEEMLFTSYIIHKLHFWGDAIPKDTVSVPRKDWVERFFEKNPQKFQQWWIIRTETEGRDAQVLRCDCAAVSVDLQCSVYSSCRRDEFV